MAKSRAVARRRARRYFARKSSGLRKFTLPLAVVAGFAPIVMGTIDHTRWNGLGGADGGIDWAIRGLTGYSPNKAYGRTWEFKRLTAGALPILIGLLTHKIAGRLGINRMLASAGIPIIRL
jgi:hypothetical protein